MQEMVNLGNEMARRIAYDTREWTALRKQQIYYGDGTTTAFNLPADFKRMLLTSNVYGSASTQSPLRFISDTDEWMQRRAAGNTDSYGEWTIMGGQMHIWPALAYGATARFAYLEKNCIVRASDNTLTDRFWSDADWYRLDSRILELGMIWQWKAWKGAPYAEDMGTWSDALANGVGRRQSVADHHRAAVDFVRCAGGLSVADAIVCQLVVAAIMSQHQAFRRVPVPQQVAQHHQTVTLPAPTRGIIESENEAYMQPGAALVCDNWVPTLRGVKLRGGYQPWCTLPEPVPIISGFEYVSGGMQRMYVGTATSLYDVTSIVPTLIKSGQSSGNYAAAQFANQGGDWLIVTNEAGDAPLRFNGSTWDVLDPTLPTPPENLITGPPDTPIENGKGLTYVWKYRNRLFFVEGGTMNAWYLGINSVGGALKMIPLSGAARMGGRLISGGVMSIDAGDGMDDKCCFSRTREKHRLYRHQPGRSQQLAAGRALFRRPAARHQRALPGRRRSHDHDDRGDRAAVGGDAEDRRAARNRHDHPQHQVAVA